MRPCISCSRLIVRARSYSWFRSIWDYYNMTPPLIIFGASNSTLTLIMRMTDPHLQSNANWPILTRMKWLKSIRTFYCTFRSGLASHVAFHLSSCSLIFITVPLSRLVKKASFPSCSQTLTLPPTCPRWHHELAISFRHCTRGLKHLSLRRYVPLVCYLSVCLSHNLYIPNVGVLLGFFSHLSVHTHVRISKYIMGLSQKWCHA